MEALTEGTAQTNPPRLAEFWEGSVFGSNRGRILLRLFPKDSQIDGSAVLFDDLFGRTRIGIQGTAVRDQAGKLVGQLALCRFSGIAPRSSLSGQCTLTIDPTAGKASGTWDTDIASGWIDLASIATPTITGTTLTWVRWQWSNFAARGVLLLPYVYAAVLALILLLDTHILQAVADSLFASHLSQTLDRFQFSTIDLIIVLLPAPFLLQRHIARLLILFGVERLSIGPIQLAAPRVSLTGDLAGSLDRFFALSTKILLLWLAGKDRVEMVELRTRAQQLGAPTVPTLTALIVSGCAIVDGQYVIASDLGRDYAAYLMRRVREACPID